MMRFVSVTVLVMVALGGARSARAQTAGTALPGGVTLSFDKLYIHEDGSEEAVLPKVVPDSLWKYFNYAHCQCGKARPTSVESNFEYLILASMATPPISEPVNIWVGTSCNADAPTRTAMCHLLNSGSQITDIQSKNNVHVIVPIYDAMNPEPTATGEDCKQRILSATVWGLADSMVGSNALDYSVSKSISTDSQPPTLPSEFRASGGDSAIQISWKPPTDTADVFGYQALCARADTDQPGKTKNLPTQRYMTTLTLCGVAQTVLSDSGTPISVPPDSPDVGSVVTLSDDLRNLNPSFLCGESIGATTDSLRIEGLENGVAYKVALVAVDKFQNVAGTYFTSTVTPLPTTDFWEDLHDRGSGAQGGLCLLAETYGDDSGLTTTLRAFRDDTLGASRVGRWLTQAYYATLAKLGSDVHGSTTLRITAAILLAPIVGFVLLWHWLTLPGALGLLFAFWWGRRWLRRSLSSALHRLRPTRAVQIAAAVALFVLAANPAHAGSGYQPYWEDGDPTPETQVASGPEVVAWHVGIRGGPYVPDIDSKFAGGTGPYAQMFGGYHVLTMLDVDRIVWSGFGQLGVGVSLGYWQKTARAFTNGSMPTDSPRGRGADTNAFRLIPTALTATYRLTLLDDNYGVPIVPYVRAGLAYDIWWITVANGDFAKVCKGDGMEPDCAQNKAFGASLGVTGSIGLAVRAERIDASTALSMRQSGIQHAGIYAELSLAKVDGFGSDKKLSVGDRTWFAGVDFEF